MDRYIEILKMLLYIIIHGFINAFLLFSIVIGAIEIINSFKNNEQQER